MVRYKYEKISIALNGEITVNVFSVDDTRPDEQIIIEHVFNPGVNIASIDSAVSDVADMVWALKTN